MSLSNLSHPESDAEYVTCGNCGMGWPTRALCPTCALRAGGADPECEICRGTTDAGLTAAHVCPEPYPYAVARTMAGLAEASGGMFVSQRQKARIRLGLRGGPDA